MVRAMMMVVVVVFDEGRGVSSSNSSSSRSSKDLQSNECAQVCMGDGLAIAEACQLVRRMGLGKELDGCSRMRIRPYRRL